MRLPTGVLQGSFDIDDDMLDVDVADSDHRYSQNCDLGECTFVKNVTQWF